MKLKHSSLKENQVTLSYSGVKWAKVAERSSTYDLTQKIHNPQPKKIFYYKIIALPSLLSL